MSIRSVFPNRSLSWPHVLCIASLVALVALGARPGAAAEVQDERARRLEDVERKLRDLLKEIEALRAHFGPFPPPPRQGEAPGARAPAAAQPAAQAGAPADGAIPEGWLKALRWRSIGPANMGGRIVDLAVCESDPSTFWVATASGGLLKTTNNGVTFEHQFDREATVSIGAVAVAPSDPKVVWVGTGESNPRNSVSYGDGVYRSTDGGKTWTNMGLKRSYQIGRIAIHPRDPNIAYVGALGRLWGPNEERGVFKTTDGGATWAKVLYVDDRTGVIDLSMHPKDPETLIAAAWERRRDGFDSWPGNQVPIPDGYQGYDPIVKWGPGSGLRKTTDGGKTWRKLTKGLPATHLGRIGLDWHRKDPSVVYAVVDCEAIGKGPEPLPVHFGAAGEDSDGKARVTQVLPDSPAEKAGLRAGDAIVAVDALPVAGFDKLLDRLRAARPGQKVALVAARGSETLALEVVLRSRPGAGRGFGSSGSGPWLGILGASREGKTELTEVIPEGPAAKAGLAPGDIVLEIDGKPVGELDEIAEQVRGRQAGDKVTLRVARGSEAREVVVELEERPAGEAGGARRGPPPSPVYLGIQGEDAEGGARLTEITSEGPAEKAGLEVGDIVQAVEGKRIADYEDLVEGIRARKAGDVLALTVLRGGETKQVTATLENRPGGPSRTRPYGFSLGGQSPNVQDQQGSKGFEHGGVYRSSDGGESWTRLNSLNSRPMYFSVVRVDPNDDKLVCVLGVSQY
ncbi:MAG: PDZ domain-containing protein, partial [Planctomycetes bacterium]|nr:PDZ domain-containing protein [Planctomycetota bacterium]